MGMSGVKTGLRSQGTPCPTGMAFQVGWGSGKAQGPVAGPQEHCQGTGVAAKCLQAWLCP